MSSAVKDPSVPPADGTCHFTGLPRELRDDIYGLSFIDSVGLFTLQQDWASALEQDWAIAYEASTLHDRVPKKLHGFLHSNKQLHTECLEIFWAKTTLIANDKDSFLRCMCFMPQHLVDRIRDIHCLDRIFSWDFYFMPGDDDRFQNPKEHTYERAMVKDRKLEAQRTLGELEKFRLELAARGTVIKPGVLKAEVYLDDTQRQWAWKE